MSRLLEYLSLVPKGIPNVVAIVEGIITDIEFKYKVLSEDSRNEIIRRRLICFWCPFNNTNAESSNEHFELTKEHYSTCRCDKHCSLCGCPIDIRTASLSSNCGAESWNDQNPHNKIELKWKKYVQKI